MIKKTDTFLTFDYNKHTEMIAIRYIIIIKSDDFFYNDIKL